MSIPFDEFLHQQYPSKKAIKYVETFKYICKQRIRPNQDITFYDLQKKSIPFKIVLKAVLKNNYGIIRVFNSKLHFEYAQILLKRLILYSDKKKPMLESIKKLQRNIEFLDAFIWQYIAEESDWLQLFFETYYSLYDNYAKKMFRKVHHRFNQPLEPQTKTPFQLLYYLRRLDNNTIIRHKNIVYL